MACNCGSKARTARITKRATRIATRKANKNIAIKPAQPKRVQPKKVTAKPAKPCNCT